MIRNKTFLWLKIWYTVSSKIFIRTSANWRNRGMGNTVNNSWQEPTQSGEWHSPAA